LFKCGEGNIYITTEKISFEREEEGEKERKKENVPKTGRTLQKLGIMSR
jgi:hypothetical protein